MQVNDIVKNDSLTALVEAYTRWFYSNPDGTWIPTPEYMEILEGRGYERDKMRLFRRGIDGSKFRPDPPAKGHSLKELGVGEGFTILYSGRVSKDKNLDFLFDIYKELLKRYGGVNLLIVGDGPYLGELKKKAGSWENVHFTGRVAWDVLPEIYSRSDLLVFPSKTDTYGMVVMEAQSCGLAAVVSDVGGPGRLLVNGETGFVAEADNMSDWVGKIGHIFNLKRLNPGRFTEMRKKAREHAVERFDWDSVLKEWLGGEAPGDCGRVRAGGAT